MVKDGGDAKKPPINLELPLKHFSILEEISDRQPHSSQQQRSICLQKYIKTIAIKDTFN